MKKKPPERNPVHKNMEQFNKPKTFECRKTKAKKGYNKHKKSGLMPDYYFISSSNSHQQII